MAKILRIGGPSKSRQINKEAIKIVQIKAWKVWIWNMEEVEYALKVKSSELFNGLSKGCEGKKDLRVTPKFLFWLTQCVVVQWGGAAEIRKLRKWNKFISWRCKSSVPSNKKQNSHCLCLVNPILLRKNYYIFPKKIFFFSFFKLREGMVTYLQETWEIQNKVTYSYTIYYKYF